MKMKVMNSNRDLESALVETFVRLRNGTGQ